ncbi:MAG TPA: GNAT family N-acetyltransferase [Rhizomicrobium sp.]|jgi:GNAT superfamily N-acetyltransferase
MPAAIQIRPARVEERGALEDLQRRASLAWEEYREALLAHPDAIALPEAQIADGRVAVAEVNGEITGFVVVLPRADGEAELDGLFVEPAHWGKWIGRLLVEQAERMARAIGGPALHVIANPQALGFYEKCGFVEQRRAETRFGPAIAMSKPLRLFEQE